MAALATTSFLSETYRRMYNPDAAKIEPEAVIRVLNQAGVKFVLMGAHGIGGWMQNPRATRDVDVLVQKSHHKKAVRAIEQGFPALVRQEHAAVTRFIDPADQKVAIDLMKPVDVYREAFRNTVRIGDSHQVPNLEMALAAKFAALVSRSRSEDKKHLDASDFIQMVRCNHDRIDKARLSRLGDAVYEGGGNDLARLVEDVKAGRRFRIELPVRS